MDAATTESLAQIVGIAAALATAAYGGVRGHRAQKAKAEELEKEAEAEATAAEERGEQRAIDGMQALVTLLMTRVDQQDRKIVAQDDKIARQDVKIEQQDAKIDALESDHRSAIGYIERLHDWILATMRIIRELAPNTELPPLPALAEALRHKITQPWSRES